MMDSNSFKFIWASSIELESGFKQHPSGPSIGLGLRFKQEQTRPQALDLGLSSNKSNHE